MSCTVQLSGCPKPNIASRNFHTALTSVSSIRLRFGMRANLQSSSNSAWRLDGLGLAKFQELLQLTLAVWRQQTGASRRSQCNIGVEQALQRRAAEQQLDDCWQKLVFLFQRAARAHIVVHGYSKAPLSQQLNKAAPKHAWAQPQETNTAESASASGTQSCTRCPWVWKHTSA